MLIRLVLTEIQAFKNIKKFTKKWDEMRTNPDISCRLVPSPSRYEIRWKRGNKDTWGLLFQGGHLLQMCKCFTQGQWFYKTKRSNYKNKSQSEGNRQGLGWTIHPTKNEGQSPFKHPASRASFISLCFILYVPQEKALLAGCLQDTLGETVLICFP